MDQVDDMCLCYYIILIVDWASCRSELGHRTVPVEVGRHIDDEMWTERLMTIADFVDKFLQPSADSIKRGG